MGKSSSLAALENENDTEVDDMCGSGYPNIFNEEELIQAITIKDIDSGIQFFDVDEPIRFGKLQRGLPSPVLTQSFDFTKYQNISSEKKIRKSNLRRISNSCEKCNSYDHRTKQCPEESKQQTNIKSSQKTQKIQRNLNEIPTSEKAYTITNLDTGEVFKISDFHM